MAEKQKKEVVEKTTEQPKIDNTVDKLKVKKKPTMKKFSQEDETIKVDMSKPPKKEEDIVQEQKVNEVDIDKSTENNKKVVEEVLQEKEESVQNEEIPILEEITDKETEDKIEKVTEQVEEAIIEAKETGQPLPENIQKVVDFINDTGGDLEDYVALNRDYDKVDDASVLYEYYKQTKPHLSQDELNFLMEDTFAYEEDVDDEKDIKRKQLAFKEQVAGARAHLDRQKSKYYADIKAGAKLTKEQQEAIDFYNNYNKELEENQKLVNNQLDTFKQKTNQVFDDKFKGFEYSVGDKKYRFNVKDANKVKENQSDINNFIKKFLNKSNEMNDAAGYHKSLFTAMNPDAVAQHFYEQGKTDAMKNSVEKAKNVDMSPRQSHGQVEVGGVKYKVLGDSSSDFKFQIKNKK